MNSFDFFILNITKMLQIDKIMKTYCKRFRNAI